MLGKGLKFDISVAHENYVCGGYTVFTLSRPSFRPSVCPSMTFWFFLNILKRQ